jgi:hypothetical protein
MRHHNPYANPATRATTSTTTTTAASTRNPLSRFRVIDCTRLRTQGEQTGVADVTVIKAAVADLYSKVKGLGARAPATAQRLRRQGGRRPRKRGVEKRGSAVTAPGPDSAQTMGSEPKNTNTKQTQADQKTTKHTHQKQFIHTGCFVVTMRAGKRYRRTVAGL